MQLDINRLFMASLAGLVSGVVVGGIGGRLAMRGVAILAGMKPEFSIGGTLGILIIAAIIGALFGALYGLVRTRIPLLGLWKGVAFGGFCAALLVWLFAQNLEGELAIVSPVATIGLFVWMPLVWAPATEWLLLRQGQRERQTPDREINLAWFALFALSLLAALFGMFSLSQEFISMPAIVSRFARTIGFDGFRNANAIANFLIVLTYCAFCSLLFWQGAGKRLPSLAAVGLLLFAAGFMQDGRAFISAFDFLGVGAVLSELLQFAGLASLLILLALWPDSVFRPTWGRWAMWFWLVIWFAALVGSRIIGFPFVEWPAVAQTAVVLGGLFTGLAAQLQRYRISPPAAQYSLRPLLIGSTIALLTYALVWIAQLLYPDLGGRGLSWLAKPFAFAPYLAPWLLLPLSFWLSLKRQEQSQQSSLPQTIMPIRSVTTK